MLGHRQVLTLVGLRTTPETSMFASQAPEGCLRQEPCTGETHQSSRGYGRVPVAQCAKCRVPVKYVVTPAACAAAMTSSSRIEPPGATIARTPASMRICGPSANGKNASDAATEPGRALAGPGDGEVAGVDPVDLAHADADRGAAGGEQDRVGLHRADRAPGERQVGQRGLVGRLDRRPGASASGRRRGVAVGALPSASIVSRCCISRPPEIGRVSTAPAMRRSDLHQPQVLLLGEHLERVGLERGRDDHLGEDVLDLLGRSRVTGRLVAMIPPNARHRVAGVRLAVCVSNVGTDRDAARVGVLDDRHRRLVAVVVGRPVCRVGVDVVVVGHLLAVALPALASPAPGGNRCVQRGALVRVLAVAQHVGAVPVPADPGREALPPARVGQQRCPSTTPRATS